MKVEVWRYVVDNRGSGFGGVRHYKEANLHLADSRATLRGPKGGPIAEAHVRFVSSSLVGSEYDMRLEVYVQQRKGRRQVEHWLFRVIQKEVK